MNAPEVKQIIRLVMAKKLSPIEAAICTQNPVAAETSTTAAQMRKPAMACSAEKKCCPAGLGQSRGLKFEVECETY